MIRQDTTASYRKNKLSYNEILILFALGAAGGFLSGLLGVGGGIIFIPVFEYYFGKDYGGEELVRLILANSFGAILIAGIASSIKHYRMGNFHLSIILKIALPAIVTGSILTKLIATQSWYKEEYFKGLFIFILLFTVIRSITHKRGMDEEERPVKRRTLPLIGVLAGAISALSGLGGGVAIIPLLTELSKMNIKKASAISIGVIPIIVLPYLVIYAMQDIGHEVKYQLGYVNFIALFPIAVGITIFSSYGVKVAMRSRSRVLQIIFAALILTLIIRFTIGLIE